MSGFLLDTDIPSETVRLRPDPRVAQWIAKQANETLFIRVVTIGELRRGFITAPDPQCRTRLERWLETDVLLWFGGRILPVTKEIAGRWGVIDGTCQLSGTPANTAGGMIAATALHHGLTVVTRNVKDFAMLGVSIFNPWKRDWAETVEMDFSSEWVEGLPRRPSPNPRHCGCHTRDLEWAEAVVRQSEHAVAQHGSLSWAHGHREVARCR